LNSVFSDAYLDFALPAVQTRQYLSSRKLPFGVGMCVVLRTWTRGWCHVEAALHWSLTASLSFR